MLLFGSRQDGTNGTDRVSDLAIGPDGTAILAGDTDGSWGAENVGIDDFAAVMLNTTTASVTITPAPSAVAEETPALSTTPPALSPAPVVGGPSQAPAPTPAPTPAPFVGNSSVASPGSTPSDGSSGTDTTPIVAGVVSGVAAVVLISLGVCLMRRRTREKNRASAQPSFSTSRELGPGAGPEHHAEEGISTQAAVHDDAPHRDNKLPPPHQRDDAPPSYDHAVTDEYSASDGSRGRSLPEAGTGAAVAAGARIGSGGVKEVTAERSMIATTSTADMSTAERAELAESFRGHSVAGASSVDGSVGGRSSTSGRRGSRDTVGVGRAVMEAAHELAHNCQIPGVGEAAAAVSILVKLVSDSRDVNSGVDANLRQCRSIVMMLERAAKVADQVRNLGSAASCGMVCHLR